MEEWIRLIIEGNRRALSRAITLTESSRKGDEARAAELLKNIQSSRVDSVRIGITGSPGVGKSTFINAFVSLFEEEVRIAILTIDPSSDRSGGSILGDKIRMRDLLSMENVFVRPSPSKGVLGGLGSHTWKSIQLCEAAGYQLILIETVGVGQSEIEVGHLTDEVWWLTMPGAGDEIQGMKKGILEIADRIIVSKSDTDPEGAHKAGFQIQRAFRSTLSDKKNLPVYEVSALDKTTMKTLFEDFQKIRPAKEKGESERYWFDKQWDQLLLQHLWHHEEILALKNDLWEKVQNGSLNQWEALEEWKKKIEEQWKK